MNIVNPLHLFGRFSRCDLQINYDRFVAAPHKHTAQLFLAAGVDLLVRHKGWHINKIARTGVGDILKTLPPTHPCPPAHYINHTLQLSMVMSTSLGIRVNGHGSRPELTGTRTRARDCSSPSHARRLWRVGIELSSAHDLHAMLAPINFRNAVSHDSLF